MMGDEKRKVKELALEIKEVKKTYKGGFKALNGVDLEIEEGDFFGLLGPNGAGKTTLIGIISTLVKKTNGSVRINGIQLDGNEERIKSMIGVVQQEINLHVFDKVIDIVINQAGYHGIPRKEGIKKAEKVLRQLGLYEKRNNFTRELSGGMKRRVMIARALVHDPKILILDEPTVGIDIELRLETYEFLKEINKKGTTIILTTHYLEEAETLCNKIGIINHGKILLNCKTSELIRQADNQEFIIDIDKDVSDFKSKKFEIKESDQNTFEVVIKKGQKINELFMELENGGIHIVSMKNKGSRLEQLFMDIVRKNNEKSAEEKLKEENKRVRV